MRSFLERFHIKVRNGGKQVASNPCDGLQQWPLTSAAPPGLLATMYLAYQSGHSRRVGPPCALRVAVGLRRHAAIALARSFADAKIVAADRCAQEDAS